MGKKARQERVKSPLEKLGEWLCEQECNDAAMLLGFYHWDEPKGRAIVHGDGPEVLLTSPPISVLGCVAVRPAMDPDLPVELTFGCFEGDEDLFLVEVEACVRPRLRANQPPTRGIIRKNRNYMPIVAFYRFRTGDGKIHDVLVHLWEYKPWEAAAIVMDAVRDIRSVETRPRRGLIERPSTPTRN